MASDTKRYFWKPDGTAEGTVDTKSDEPGFTWAKDGKGFFTPGKFWPRIDPSFTQFGKGSHDNVVSPDQTSVTYWSGRETIVNRFENGDAKDIEWKVPQARGGVPTFSSDGKRLAIPDSTGIALNDARDSKKVVRLGGGAAVPPLNAAVFSPKGDRLAIGSQTGHVYLCEATGKILRVIPPTKKADAAVADAISDLRWHPDGKHLVVSTGNITVTIYDTESGKAVASTSLPGATATGMAIFSPANPDHLLIAQPDVSALWRWKLEKEPIQKFPGLGKLLPSPDGKQLLSMRAGGGWYKNDPIPSSLVSMDLKTRDTNWSKAFTTVNSGTVTILWHPDGKHVVAATDGSRTITLRTLDGKVVEEIKPIGLDVTWLYLVGVTAKRNVFVGRIGADVYLCDLSTKKWSLIGKMGGELTVSPDGKHLISVSGNTISYWNLESKALEQIVQLLPDAQHVTLSPAGEVLERSAKAEGFYRYLVEDKNGRILVKTPAEMVLVPSK